MAPVRFEPTILAGERPQTYVIERAATGTSINIHIREAFLYAENGGNIFIRNFGKLYQNVCLNV